MLQSKIEPYWCQDLETGEVSGSYWKSFAMGVCLELYDPDTTLKKKKLTYWYLLFFPNFLFQFQTLLDSYITAFFTTMSCHYFIDWWFFSLASLS